MKGDWSSDWSPLLFICILDMTAHVAELVYAYASEAYGAILGGSSPLMRTKRQEGENVVESLQKQIGARIMDKSFKSRVRGCLAGVPIGDAMGMSVEAMKPKEVAALNGGSGVTSFLPRLGPAIIPTAGFKAGETTDDWQLTRAVSRSLIRSGGRLDIADCADEHVRELGTIGWGHTTTAAIENIRDGIRDPLTDPLPPAKENQGSGNGVMMKIAPIAILHACRNSLSEELWRDCRVLGMLTHQDIRASITAFAVAYVMQRCMIEGPSLDPAILLRDLRERIARIDDLEGLVTDRVSDRIAMVEPVLGDAVSLRMIPGFMRFHCMYTVTITLGTFLRHPDDFRAGVLEVVNQGGDADTNACIVGAMIGAAVGIDGIPNEWLSFNPDFADAARLADRLVEVCE